MSLVTQVIHRVEVRFTISEGDFTYSDALYFSPEEYAQLSGAMLQSLQRARFDSWKSSILTARAVEPTKADMQGRLDAIAAEKETLEAQEVSLRSRVARMR